MSTTGRGRYSVLRIFKGPPGAHRTPRDVRCSSSRWTLPPAEPFPRDRLTRVQVPFTRNLSPLRPSKFPFEYLLLPTKIRTDGRSARARAQGFAATAAPSLLIGAWRLPRRPGIGRALQRHPFSGLVDSADERFARQVSLRASTRVSSGFAPLRHSSPSFGSPTGMLTLKPFSEDQDSLVRVSRRVEWGARRPAPGARRCRSTPGRRVLSATIGGDGIPQAYRLPGALAVASIRAGPRPESIGRPAHRRSTSDRDASPTPIRFPPDNFKHSLTLFSKFFSSFPRGTCSLSVSRLYLALDGIYRPIGAAFPNNPTRRQRLVVRQGPSTTGLSPSLAPLSRGTWARSAAEDASPDYNSNGEAARFSSWAFPGSLAVY
ncbi:Uncharacterized protein Adt_48176 [Abeliophyllum distichum]|uniref:Protein TAR1 n=1 Tax=Abeliophyllum distichum TaxID=126358 RepID=A0ABD1NRV6_9LAMI